MEFISHVLQIVSSTREGFQLISVAEQHPRLCDMAQQFVGPFRAFDDKYSPCRH